MKRITFNHGRGGACDSFKKENKNLLFKIPCKQDVRIN